MTSAWPSTATRTAVCWWELRRLLPRPGQDLEELKGRHLPVSGGLQGGKDGVPGLLAADAEVPAEHFLSWPHKNWRRRSKTKRPP